MVLKVGRGQTLAEFAVVLPIFVVIVLGLFDVGRVVFAYNGLTNAVREGARLAAVNQNVDLIAQRAQAMAFGIAIETEPGEMTRFFRQLEHPEDVTLNDQCGVDVDMAVGCIAVVEADASVEAITPLIGDLIGEISLTARSELAVEFVCPNPSITAYDDPDGLECPKQP